jgi:hypothetical protein
MIELKISNLLPDLQAERSTKTYLKDKRKEKRNARIETWGKQKKRKKCVKNDNRKSNAILR